MKVLDSGFWIVWIGKEAVFDLGFVFYEMFDLGVVLLGLVGSSLMEDFQ